MHTRNCKKVHDHLNKDLYDADLIYSMMVDYFGQDNINSTYSQLEEWFGFPADSIRSMFKMVDARACELQHIAQDGPPSPEYDNI